MTPGSWGLVRQNTGQNCEAIIRLEVDTFVSLQQKFFRPSSRVNLIFLQVLGFHELGEVDTLNYGGVSAMLLVPAPTSSYNFAKVLFSKLNVATDCH